MARDRAGGQDGALVLLPTGVIEQHGPHMGLAVDIYCSWLMCQQVRAELEAAGRPTLIAPPSYWGVNAVTKSFGGSFNLRSQTLQALVYDLLVSLDQWGFKRIFNFNWHGDRDHNLVVLAAIKAARDLAGVGAWAVLDSFLARRLGLSGEEEQALVFTSRLFQNTRPECLQIHAEELETGLMAAYFPEHVDTKMARKLEPTRLTLAELEVWRLGGEQARRVTPRGYFGDPAAFDPDEAKASLEESAANAARVIGRFLDGEYQPPDLNAQKSGS